MTKQACAAPDLSAEEGIRKIRKVIAQWFAGDGVEPLDALVDVSSVVLCVSLEPVEAAQHTAQ